MAVITAPDGTQGRSESVRRYILCRSYEGKLYVLKRSDSIDAIGRAFDRWEAGSRAFVWDRVEHRIAWRLVAGRGGWQQKPMVAPEAWTV